MRRAIALLAAAAAVWAGSDLGRASAALRVVQRPTAGSASLPIDRGADLLRAELDARLARGDVRGAFTVANQMLAADRDCFVAPDEYRIVRAWEYARQRLHALPDPAHAAYEAAFGPTARRRLRAARDAFVAGRVPATGTSDGPPSAYAPWLEVYRQFPTTRAGLEALVTVTVVAIDRGDAATAAAAAAAVRAHRQFRPETHGWLQRAVAALSRSRSAAGADAADRAAGARDHSAVPSALAALAPAPAALTRPLWRAPLLVRPPSALLAGALRRFQQHGISVLPVTQPLLVGRLLVVRTLDGVRCFDSRDGRLLWQTPPESEQAREPPPVVLPEFRDRLVALLVRRWSVDTIHGRATTDGRRIFVVDPPVRSTDAYESSLDGAMQMLRMADPEVPRTLLALDAHTGRPAWRRRGVFASLPRWRLQRLWNLEFTDDGLALNALEAATGDVVHTTAVLQITDATAQTTARLLTDCDIRHAGRLLLCATAAGAVVGFDPLLHRVAFVTRFPRVSPEQPLNSMRAADRIVDWWARFRETRIEPLPDGTTIAVLPDAARLACLDSRDGRVLWSLPRRDEMALVAITGDRVLLQHSRGLRAIDRRSGAELWTAVTGTASGTAAVLMAPSPTADDLHAGPRAGTAGGPSLSGRAATAGGVALVPLAAGGWARVDVSTGRVTFPVPSWTEPPGNLLATPNHLFSLNGSVLARHPIVSAAIGAARGTVHNARNGGDPQSAKPTQAASGRSAAPNGSDGTVAAPAADADPPAGAREALGDADALRRLAAALILREFGHYEAALGLLGDAPRPQGEASADRSDDDVAAAAHHLATPTASVRDRTAAAQVLAAAVLRSDLDAAPDVVRRLRWQTLAAAVARSDRPETGRRLLPRLKELSQTAEERLAARVVECYRLFLDTAKLARSGRTRPSQDGARADERTPELQEAIEHTVRTAFDLLETAPETPIDTGDLGLAWTPSAGRDIERDAGAARATPGWDLSAYGLLGWPVVGQRRTVSALRLVTALVWDGLVMLERSAPEATQQAVRTYFAGIPQRADPFAVQRVARRTEWWPEGAALRLNHRDAAEIGESAIAAELALWRLVQRSQGAARHRAYHALFSFYMDQRHEYDALAVLHRWRRDVPGGVVLTGSADRRGTAEGPSALTAPATGVPPIRPSIPPHNPLRRLLAGRLAPWPEEAPPVQSTVDERSRIDRDVYYVPVPIRTVAAGTLDRVSVSLDRSGRVLRFDSDLVDGPWKLRLPSGRSPFRQAYTTYCGWAIGRLLVVQLGSELFGVRPFDDAGEPLARVLWSSDVLSAFDVVAMLQGEGPPGLHDRPVHLVDAMGDAVAHVVDVAADRIAILDGGRLRILDPLTGRLVWQRGRFPLATRVVPLERDLLVLLPPGMSGLRALSGAFSGHDPETLRHRTDARTAPRAGPGAASGHTALLLRGIDGAIVEQSVIRTPPGAVWLTDGWEWVAGEPLRDGERPGGWRIRRVDVRSGSVLWESRLAGSAPFVFPDERIVGAIGGTAIRLLDATTGQPLGGATLPATDARRAIVTRDADRLYVLAVESAVSTPLAAVDQIRSGWRNPLATGRLCALSRRDARLLWTIRWRDAAFALDVPRHAPVLVSAFQIPGNSGAGNLHRSVIRVHDSRTGTRLCELTGNQGDVYWSIEAHPRDRWFDLITRRRIERFRFPRADGDDSPKHEGGAPTGGGT